MRKIPLGRTNIEISRIGLGCMQLSAFYPPFPPEQESIDLIHAALQDGVNFFDTSDIYGPHTNEILLGKAFKDVPRESFVLATKFGIRRVDGKMSVCGEPEYVKQCCYASLERLGMDYVDLYYAHRIDRNVPIEDTVRAMAELVSEGKVRSIGLSECSEQTLRRAHAVHPISAIQWEYSLFCLAPEQGLLNACKELGITFVAYSPLGRGFLTGKYKSVDDLEQNDMRRTNPRFIGENWQKNMRLVNEVEKMAQEKGCTAGQIALAWVLSQGDNINVIPGTKSVKYLRENNQAENVELNEDDLVRLREILTTFPTEGERYHESSMILVNV